MKYHNTIEGIFENRPNRFIAHVNIEGNTQSVHVKNTGRCRELLIPGARVLLETSDNPKRKTKWDLISVYKEKFGWINIDSQAPNKAMQEWLRKQDYDLVRPEYTYGESRIDFYMEKGERKYLVEVKGCTLEIDGIGYFPDAPTERGIRHLQELEKAKREGYETAIAFVIPMEGITEVRGNRRTHPAFADALEDAHKNGVQIWYMTCAVSPDALSITGRLTAASETSQPEEAEIR